MKNIIISGPPNTGKTTIANAIAATHKTILKTNYRELMDDLECGIDWDWLLFHSLILVEECTPENILELAPKFLIIPMVFVTLHQIDSESKDYKDFMVIKLPKL